MSSFISLTDLIYPVGSYYLSNSSTSPSSRFGGTWTQVTGRFPYFNSNTNTGGTSTHAHQYGIRLYPVRAMLTFPNSQSTDNGLLSIPNWVNETNYTFTDTTSWGESSWHGVTNASFVGLTWKDTGATAALSTAVASTSYSSTYPSYRGVYAWYRTA